MPLALSGLPVPFANNSWALHKVKGGAPGGLSKSRTTGFRFFQGERDPGLQISGSQDAEAQERFLLVAMSEDQHQKDQQKITWSQVDDDLSDMEQRH